MRRIEKEIREIKNLMRQGGIEAVKSYLQEMSASQKKELLLEISQKALDVPRDYEDRPNWKLPGFGDTLENPALTAFTKLTELHYALKAGRFEEAVALTENTPLYPDTQMVSDKTESGHALTYAAKSGNLALVKYLCEQYEADSFKDEKISDMVKALALNAACERGHEDVADYLLLRGANPNYVLSHKDWDSYGDEPYSKILVSAIHSKKLNLVRMLVDNGAIIHDPALEVALCDAEQNITQFLFERNIWVRLKGVGYHSRYMKFASISGSVQKLVMLVNDYKLDLPHMVVDDYDLDSYLSRSRPESLLGRWNQKVEQHPITNERIFTLRITRNGEEIGSAQYYKHPLFCRSESGDRHNVLKTSGILSQFKLDTNTTDVICAVLPPTFFEELMQCASHSIKHSAIRGLAKVIGHAAAASKKSKMTVEMTQYGAYLFGYFLLCCYDNRQSQNNDGYLNAVLNTTFMAAINIFMLCVCYALKSVGNYAAEHGWNKTGNIFRLGNEYAQYGIFAMDAKQRGIVAAVSSIASGYTAQSVVETVGNRVIDRVLGN